MRRSLLLLAIAAALAPTVQAASDDPGKPDGVVVLPETPDCAHAAVAATDETEARADVYIMKGSAEEAAPPDQGDPDALAEYVEEVFDAAWRHFHSPPSVEEQTGDVRVTIVYPSSPGYDGYRLGFSVQLHACVAV